ncbi:uncharacterized protein EI97DRAFT_437245 [Westerdykella ornata]|uniref:Uncharacterized protein n=1 Tax=Westerdykella ornata TaxID=318751 RepID=A0A6A6J757_WESOR|nr:uncharacterized protein EI97DRAFT_437245 [Westerdykella ornata]KAF2272064.1 hypothetical protein EI97DRAFT_437245 [Westerdykella ornata]
MVYLTTLLSLALAGGALALPTDVAPANFTTLSPIEARSLERRQPGGVFITTDIKWGGLPGYAKQPWDICIQLDAPWYKSISSIGPDSGNAVVLSEDYNCGTANRVTILNPGNDDLRSIGWNDRAGSFMVRQVAVVNGRECIRSVDPSTFPGLNCQFCCNGCSRSGTSCCPEGQIC